MMFCCGAAAKSILGSGAETFGTTTMTKISSPNRRTGCPCRNHPFRRTHPMRDDDWVRGLRRQALSEAREHALRHEAFLKAALFAALVTIPFFLPWVLWQGWP